MRGPGRPRTNWRYTVKKDIQRLGLTWEEIEVSVLTDKSGVHMDADCIKVKFSCTVDADACVTVQLQVRQVCISRDKPGGLGLSVKGGAEHNLPILVSRIFKDQAGTRSPLSFHQAVSTDL